MASYEVEHNVKPPANPTSSNPPRRPDLSTFFSTLEHVDTTSVSNSNAQPIPSDVSAAFRTLGEAFQQMRLYRGEEGPLDGMIESLFAEAEQPPKEVKGVSQSFLDELERVPRKILKKEMDCPICGNAFLDDEYPLVVRLPCNRSHMFDLECIAPWLKLHATCPLDRKNLVKEKAPPPPPDHEEEDGEWDDMYA
ncbi:tRNA (uridine-2'-O-)-methyltransferase trm7 [Lecanora helva]